MAEPQTNQPASPTAEREVSEQERALAGRWEKKIKTAKQRQKDQRQAPADLKKLREYVNGKQHDDGASGLVRTNLIFATLAGLLPYVYAKNPDISVVPSEAVDDGQYEVVKRFGKTLEIVLRRLMVIDAHLKKRAKSTVRSAMTTGIGWIKVQYQRDYGSDPIIQNRIADVQDNLKRLQYLTKEVESDKGDQEANKAELEQQLRALQERVEVIVSEGVVIDRILTEDLFILDESIRDFDAYPQSRAISHRVWFSKEAYAETFGHEAPMSATIFKHPKDDDSSNSDGQPQHFVAVHEIWDRISQTIYTKCEGATQWSREPYQPQKLGQRWYPFFALGFNPIDGQFEPLSDVELLKELQDEYNTTRTNFAQHRKENLPGMVVRAGGSLDEGDIDKIVKRKINEVVVIGGDSNIPLSNELIEIKGVPIDPAVYETSPIRNDMDMVVGMSDASRSNIMKPKTLGEAEIMREGMMSRTTERQDAVEDVLQEVAQYCAEICLQELTLPQVQRIAGVGASWPQLSKDDIFDLVQIQIRAGSTGKPNKQQEREQWIEFMPTFQEMVTKIVELRQQGQVDMAKALTEMLKETLRRFDERLELDLFIPNDDEGQQLQQILQQVQQRAQELEIEVDKLRPMADKNLMDYTIARMNNETQIEIAREKKSAAPAGLRTDIPLERHFAMDSAPPETAAPSPTEPDPIAAPESPAPSDAPAGQSPPSDTGTPEQDPHAAVMAVLDRFGQMIEKFSNAMSHDRVPVRDKSGQLVRLIVDRPPPEAAPAAPTA